jgi:hypothetical protein
VHDETVQAGEAGMNQPSPETVTVTIRFAKDDYCEFLHDANRGDYRIATVLRAYINLGRKTVNKPRLLPVGHRGRPKGAKNK